MYLDFFNSALHPVTDQDMWKERYGIEPKSSQCEDCGEHLIPSIPFATKEARGLVAPTCVCGSIETPFAFVYI